jgi:hypothetical protein
LEYSMSWSYDRGSFVNSEQGDNDGEAFMEGS